MPSLPSLLSFLFFDVQYCRFLYAHRNNLIETKTIENVEEIVTGEISVEKIRGLNFSVCGELGLFEENI